MEAELRFRGRGMQFNERKRQGLAIFAERDWLNPPAWAALAGFYPTRAAYSYLARLARWGLLERRQKVRGLLLYRLSERGRRRLAWLASNEEV
jgi:hypothetical protein